MTRYHSLSSLETIKMYRSQCGKAKNKILAWLRSGGGRPPHSLCLLVVSLHGGGAGGLSGATCTRRSPHSWELPTHGLSTAQRPHLLIPANTITSGIRISTQESRRGHKHSDDSNYISSVFSSLTSQCIWKRQIFKFALLPVEKLSQREMCNCPKSTGKGVPLTDLEVTSPKSYCVPWLGILFLLIPWWMG